MVVKDNLYSVKLLNYSVFASSLNKLDLGCRTIVNTINQYSFCIAEEDIQFKKALQASDVLLPDGIGITMANLLINKKRIQKIAGADVHEYLLVELNKKSGSCFYLGSSQKTLDKIKKRLATEYPNIRVGAFSPPYKPVFSAEECEEMIKAANAHNPDVLFVGMTAPKQEKWVEAFKNQLNARIICSIGAVFDFYAQTVDRPDKIWINLGLEWFVRLLKEPKRMWKRYFYYGPIFVWYILFKRPTT